MHKMTHESAARLCINGYLIHKFFSLLDGEANKQIKSTSNLPKVGNPCTRPYDIVYN